MKRDYIDAKFEVISGSKPLGPTASLAASWARWGLLERMTFLTVYGLTMGAVCWGAAKLAQLIVPWHR